jgi:hypothetical protein
MIELWSRPREEPLLSDILKDPIVQILMAKDRIPLAEMLTLISRIRISIAG